MRENFKPTISTLFFTVNRSQLSNRIDPIYYGLDLDKFIKKFAPVKLNKVVLNFKSGVGAGKHDQAEGNDGVIQIRPTNINNDGILKYDKNIYLPYDFKGDKLSKGDVLFNNTNSQELVGKTAILKEDKELFYSNHITRIQVDLKVILPEYLWIILNLYQEHKIFYKLCTNWNNQSGIGLNTLKSLPIPLPPIEVQQQVVNIYNTAYCEKQKKEEEAKRLLANIDDYLLDILGITLPKQDNSLTTRIFTTNFGNVVGSRFDPDYNSKIYFLITQKSKFQFKALKDFLIKSPQYGANEEAINITSNDDIRYIRITDIDELGYLKSDKSKTAFNVNEKYMLNHNDILFARSGSVGRCYIHKKMKNHQYLLAI